jgi:hypothetical protein
MVRIETATIAASLQKAMDEKNQELGTEYVLSQALFPRDNLLDIPDNWPKPWVELSSGKFTIFGREVFRYKKYKRHGVWGMYGFNKSYRYLRFWYGLKVLHLSFIALRPRKFEHHMVTKYFIEGMHTDKGYSRAEMRELIMNL